MKFSEMIEKNTEEIISFEESFDFEINKLCYNSMLVESGDVFFAIKGIRSDGNKYINDAFANGASAVITDQFPDIKDSRICQVDDVRKSMALMSGAYYGNPSLKLKVIGVTGTNGKTTVTSLINHALENAGKKTGLIGTNGNYINKRFIETVYTTPESIELNKLLADMSNEGVEFVTMEVSSHSLVLNRVYAIDFDTAVFTNLTPEHLDFHVNMDNYFKAKKILFNSILRINQKGHNTSVIYNSDDLYGSRIVNGTESERVSFGFEHAMFSVENLKMGFDGMSFEMLVPLNGEGMSRISISTKLIGKFNVYNILAAAAALKSLKIPLNSIANAIKSFNPVEGRFNQVPIKNKVTAIIDYSHTPDSLLKAISTIREILDANNSKGKIITVFGCGGNRDRTKRPKMGEIATKYSDHAIITSDNPRDEDPFAIIEDIKAGIKSDNYSVEENREKAIEKALMMSKEGDIILVAGKGHETYQEIKGVKYHLSDKEIVGRFS
jgi:UDP-N-acetylmuramoyl-L-alanyl-D-glutamate--2,6-diaminopimelate ligase